MARVHDVIPGHRTMLSKSTCKLEQNFYSPVFPRRTTSSGRVGWKGFCTFDVVSRSGRQVVDKPRPLHQSYRWTLCIAMRSALNVLLVTISQQQLRFIRMTNYRRVWYWRKKDAFDFEMFLGRGSFCLCSKFFPKQLSLSLSLFVCWPNVFSMWEWYINKGIYWNNKIVHSTIWFLRRLHFLHATASNNPSMKC